MALEPAGIDLQAKGFTQYIGQLNKIDKAQQKAFDVDVDPFTKSIKKLTSAVDDLADEMKSAGKSADKFSKSAARIGAGVATGVNTGVAVVGALTNAIVTLGSTAASVFSGMVKEGVELNKQFELSEKVFTNVFGDPNLGAATVDFLNETADSLRVGRKEAAQFAQTILPKSGGLDKFTELLRLTDIQADTTGQSVGELEFSIREALSGDFVSLKDRFDLGTEQINKIKELTPELGRSQALITVLTEEFTRLGKTDISGTLGTNIKDLNSQFTNLQATLGKPVFDILKQQTDNLLQSLNRNETGIKRTAIALGEVTGNVVELVGTELVAFIDSLDFAAIEVGINRLNAFVETVRVMIVVLKEGFSTGVLQTGFGLLTGNVQSLTDGFTKLANADFSESFKKISNAASEGTKRQDEYKKRVNEAATATSSFTDESRDAIDAFLQQSEAETKATASLANYSNTLKQAENLQRSFARAAEDTALKLARANEDIARKQAKSVEKLQSGQAKDRDKLLQNQAKQLDDFEKNRRKQINDAEGEIKQARREAGEQRKRDQQKLQRELQRAQERFDLSRLQSTRRFSLQESRLRAEGDILGLKELREDFALQQTEEKENFDLSKKEQVSGAKAQQKEQSKDLEKRLKTLKTNLEDQRADLLASFDEQLKNQQLAQTEARAEQQLGFQEAAADRAIALAREEEDRRISQARQLEDLGRSLAEQQGVTAEGSAAIAGELEKVFGIEGVADNIMSGFKEKTENDFTELFENLQTIVSDAEIKAEPIPVPVTPVVSGATTGSGSFGGRIGGVQEFAEGGVVGGPTGSPQMIMAHGGETVLPTHKASFAMAAPVIPSQNVDVSMSGGFNITGGEQAGEAAVQAAVTEMTDNFRIAVRRLARKN